MTTAPKPLSAEELHEAREFAALRPSAFSVGYAHSGLNDRLLATIDALTAERDAAIAGEGAMLLFIEDIQETLQNGFPPSADRAHLYVTAAAILASPSPQAAALLAEVAALRATKSPAPNAAYICGPCGKQWYDGIQNDCGHHKNERDYCRPSPCKAVLKGAP